MDGSILVINYDEFNKLISQKCYQNSDEFMNSNCGSDYTSILDSGEIDKTAFHQLIDQINNSSSDS